MPLVANPTFISHISVVLEERMQLYEVVAARLCRKSHLRLPAPVFLNVVLPWRQRVRARTFVVTTVSLTHCFIVFVELFPIKESRSRTFPI